MQTVALVDLGMGNLRSVERALLRASDEASAPSVVTRTSDPAEIARADKVVVPGQGAFRNCAASLATGIGQALHEQIRKGTPYLGICLGMQVLFDTSEEAPGAAGLGVFAGTVERLADGTRDPETNTAVKIPHMGWNRLTFTREVRGPLRRLSGESLYVYFVHSYHAVPRDAELIAATTEHGPHRITAALERENVTATQFHPEKSQKAGIYLLSDFLSG